jgi:hypothetical protein
MKRLHVTPLLLSLMLAATAGMATAQSSTGSTGAAPMQMKMERSEFMRMFMWDEASEMWVMRANVQPPAGVRSRAEVKAERDTFLSMNHWDNGKSAWVPVTGAPRNMSTMTREQVKAETANYLRTHRYDEPTGKWTPRSTGGSQ